MENIHKNFYSSNTSIIKESQYYPIIEGIAKGDLVKAKMKQEYNRETLFPIHIIQEIIELGKEKNAVFKTYADFPLKLYHPLFDKLSYIKEYFAFKTYSKSIDKKLAALFFICKNLFSRKITQQKGTGNIYKNLPSNLKSKERPIIILAHDADQQPYKTVDLLEYEKELGVVSSAFFFYQQNVKDRVDDYDPYIVEVEKLKKLENHGFDIGYHLNAYELADYDLQKAFEIIDRDIEWFEANFNLKTFVPHGGIPGPGGINNEMIPYRGKLRNYTWCYNGNDLGRDFNWSDGYCTSRDMIDPRLIIKQLQPGDRAVFLMHPQYYGTSLMKDYEQMQIPMANEKWWLDLWGL